MTFQVFLDETRCRSVNGCRRFEGLFCFRLQVKINLRLFLYAPSSFEISFCILKKDGSLQNVLFLLTSSLIKAPANSTTLDSVGQRGPKCTEY